MTLAEMHDFLKSRGLVLRSAHLVGTNSDIVDSFTCDESPEPAALSGSVLFPAAADDASAEPDALETFVNRKAAK